MNFSFVFVLRTFNKKNVACRYGLCLFALNVTILTEDTSSFEDGVTNALPLDVLEEIVENSRVCFSLIRPYL